MMEPALLYAARGWSVLPLCPRGKRPAVSSWQEYQSRRATGEEIQAWWREAPDANIGVVTGAISGLVVLDIDGAEAVKYARQRGVPLTPAAETGKGWHVYFAHPGGSVPNAVALDGIKGLDVRADGGYVVAPPSVHPSGRVYAWAKGRSPDERPLAPCPPWLLGLLAGRSRGGASVEPGWAEKLILGVKKNERNDTCARLAGRYLGKGLSESEVLALLLMWNRQNKPPLPEMEVEKVVRSVAGREARKRETRKPARAPVWLDGPVYAPAGEWSTLALCSSYTEARRLAAEGCAVVVCRGGRLPAHERRVVELASLAQTVKAAGFSDTDGTKLVKEAASVRIAAQLLSEAWDREKARRQEKRENPEPARLENSRFGLECWLKQRRSDLLAAVRDAEAECERAYWDAQAGFPEALRAAEARLEAALQAGFEAWKIVGVQEGFYRRGAN